MNTDVTNIIFIMFWGLYLKDFINKPNLIGGAGLFITSALAMAMVIKLWH